MVRVTVSVRVRLLSGLLSELGSGLLPGVCAHAHACAQLVDSVGRGAEMLRQALLPRRCDGAWHDIISSKWPLPV